MMVCLTLPFQPFGHHDGATSLDGRTNSQVWSEHRAGGGGDAEFIYQGGSDSYPDAMGDLWGVIRHSAGHGQ